MTPTEPQITNTPEDDQITSARRGRRYIAGFCVVAAALVFAHFDEKSRNAGPSPTEKPTHSGDSFAAHQITTWTCDGFATYRFNDRGTFVALSDANYRAAGKYQKIGNEVAVHTLVNLNDESRLDDYRKFKIQESGSSITLTEVVHSYKGSPRPTGRQISCQETTAHEVEQAPAQAPAPVPQIREEVDATAKLSSLFNALSSSQDPRCESIASDIANQLDEASRVPDLIRAQNERRLKMLYQSQYRIAQQIGCI